MADPEIKRDELRRERRKRFAEREKQLDEIRLFRDKAWRRREAVQKAYEENKSEITALTTLNNRIEDLRQQSRQTSAQNQQEQNALLEEMKKADKQILEASSKRTQLFDDLNKARSEEESLQKREKDKKLELDKMKDCDQSKHAKIQVYIQQNLETKNIKLLLDYLVLRKTVTEKQREDLRDFFDIWQYLSSLDVRRGGIEVGDLKNIRKYLSDTLEDSKKLVEEIEKKEDALLGEYKNGGMPILKAEDDTQSKQIKSFSQMIDANIKHKKYEVDGGPFKYLSDVLVVVRLYLAQLNTRDKSEVTDALHDYVKSRLEQSDILTLVDGHLREHKKGTGKIEDLQANIKERDKKILEFEREMKKWAEAQKTERLSWWDKVRSTLDKAKKEKEDYQKTINDYEKMMKDFAENWEEARQKMVYENVELRAQKESTDKHMEKMMEQMMAERQLWDTRFENRGETIDNRAVGEENMDPERQREELRRKRKKRLDGRQKELVDIELLLHKALREREEAEKAYDENQSEIRKLTEQKDRIEVLRQQSRRTSARNQLKENYTSRLEETDTEKERKKEDLESERVSLQQIAILEEIRSNADEPLLRALSETNALSDELDRAKSEVERLEKRQKNIKFELKHMTECENAKHAKIMTHIQEHLVTGEIKLLLDYLQARGIIKPRKREEMHGDFFKIWEHLTGLEVADGGIAVGNLWKLRQYLSAALENSKNLVKEIEKMEDELLRQYQQGNTPNQDRAIFSSDGEQLPYSETES